MQFLVEPLFSVSPALSLKAQKEVQNLINTVATGAFEQNPDYIFSATHSCGGVSTNYRIEFDTKIGPSDARELALRLAETTLQLIKIHATQLGISVRQSGTPSVNMLRLPGLTCYRIRCQLAEFFASFASIGTVEFTSHLCDIQIRVATGRPLGSTGLLPVLLSSTLVSRRKTQFGEVIRIKTGGKLISIVVPPDLVPSVGPGGAAFHTTPIVGLIPRRLLKIEHRQFPLFNG